MSLSTEKLSYIKQFLKISKIIFLVSAVLASFSVWTQDAVVNKEHLTFNQINDREGLSSLWVNIILEDERGYMWVGTRFGLGYYGGNSFENFFKGKNKNSLRNNDISHLSHGLNGQIIISTWGGGIHSLNPISKEIKRIGVDGGELSQLRVKEAIQDKNGNFWIATYGKGLYYYNPKKDSTVLIPFEKISDKLENYIETIHEFQGKIWVGTRDLGLCYYDKRRKLLVNEDLGEKVSNEITVIKDDGDKLWLGTHLGEIFSYSPNQKAVQNLYKIEKRGLTSPIFDFLLDKNKQLWISSTLGFYRMDINNGKISEIVKSESENSLLNTVCLAIDVRGILWVGTWGSGFYKYNMVNFNTNKYSLESLGVSSILSIYKKSPKILLIGTNQGLVEFDMSNNKATKIRLTGKYASLCNDNPIVGISPLGEGYALCIESKGVVISTTNFECFNILAMNGIFNRSHITCTATDYENNLWVGTWGDGLFKISPNLNVEKIDLGTSAPENYILTLLIEGQKKIWVGHREGVYTNDLITNKLNLKPFSKSNNYPDQMIADVSCISQDYKGNLWMAVSNGLVSYDAANDRFIDLPQGDVNFHTGMNSMVEVNREIWGTSIFGLIKINPTWLTLSSYKMTEGATTNSYEDQSMVHLFGDQLLITNANTLSFINPKAFVSKVNNSIYLRKITNLLGQEIKTVNKDHVSMAKEIVLKHKENSFKIEFDILNFNHNNRITLAHKLEGYDKEWKQHSYNDNVVVYNNLPTGDYILKYVVVEGNQVIETQSKALRIKVESHSWANGWVAGWILFATIVFIIWAFKRLTNAHYFLQKDVDVKIDLEKESNDRSKEFEAKYYDNEKYLSVIQSNIMPDQKAFEKIFEDNFILFMPNEKVSKDLYWAIEIDNKKIVIVADCPGAGSLGALRTVFLVNQLKNIIYNYRITSPKLIVSLLLEEIVKINLSSVVDFPIDNFAISAMVFNTRNSILEITTCNQNVYLSVDNGDLLKIKSNKLHADENKIIRLDLHQKQIKTNFLAYLCTDGFQNQIGEKNVGKYSSNKLLQFLIDNSNEDLGDQRQSLLNEFAKFKASEPQNDDVTILGIKYTLDEDSNANS